jgi:streptomycin 6-kinase
LLEELAGRWRLELAEPLRGGLLSVVRLVRTEDGVPAVLKLSSPWARPADEAAALGAWRGGGAPRLLAWDAARGALLLERIEPGDAAPGTAAEVARLLAELHSAPPPPLPALADVAARRLDRALAQGSKPAHKVAWARAKLEELLQAAGEPVLCHGDFDGRNILRCHRRGLCGIDPLPCTGDPAYDAGYWAHANGAPGRRARTTEIAAAMRLPVDRVRGWCAIVAVHG